MSVIVAHPRWVLCRCNTAVATVSMFGGWLCKSCAAELRKNTVSQEETFQHVPAITVLTLDELLGKLTREAP